MPSRQLSLSATQNARRPYAKPERLLRRSPPAVRTVKLTAKNFASIARTAREFENYIAALRAKDGDAVREAEVRDDDYDHHQLPAKKTYNLGPRAGIWGPTVREPPEQPGRRTQTKRQEHRPRNNNSEEGEEDEDVDDEAESESDDEDEE